MKRLCRKKKILVFTATSVQLKWSLSYLHYLLSVTWSQGFEPLRTKPATGDIYTQYIDSSQNRV